MNISNNLFGSCSNSTSKNESDFFDLQALVNRLLLFEQFILYSPNLKEIPFLVRAFGFDGTLALLASGALKISCEVRITAQVGQTDFLVPGGKALPLGTYSILYGFAADRREWIGKNLKNVRTPNLSNNQVKKLKLAVVESFDNNYLQDFYSELNEVNNDLASNRGLKRATVIALKKERNINANPDDFSIRLHQVNEQIFKAETNLDKVYSLNELEVHKIVEKAILGIGGLNQRITEMKIHNALSGFLEDESPLFGDRLEFLFQSIDPKSYEENFSRVLQLKKIPDIVPESTKIVNVEKLLEVRSSQELKVFREWLRNAEDLSDSEIIDQLNNIRSKLGVLVQGNSGKMSRLAISTLAGFIPGAGVVAGLGLGAIDAFLLERILPYSSVVAFIDKLYPSIFQAGSSGKTVLP